jgi:hypothetical protein
MTPGRPNQLHVDVRPNGESAVIYFSGLITDAARPQLTMLVKQVTATKCSFNLKGISSIDSLGVRGWIQFMRDFSVGRTLVFEECSPDVVMQINMVPAFLQPASLASIYTLYQCDECGETRLRLVNLDQAYATGNADLPEEKCLTCQVQMEPDSDGQLCLTNFFEGRRRAQMKRAQ